MTTNYNQSGSQSACSTTTCHLDGCKAVLTLDFLPVISVGVSGRLFPALIRFWVQKTVVSMYWVTEVISVVLLT